jgi:hypothetical protein
MTNQTIDLQASMFLFDLGNSAKEHWFKAEETWEVSLATDDEKLAMEKKYFPTVSIKVLPEQLAELYGLIKRRSTIVHSDVENTLNTDTIIKNHLQYLIAFNPNRQRS